MKAVDVLAGINRFNHGARADLLRKRELHENAVDGGICVQSADEIKERLLIGIGGKTVLMGGDARPFAGAGFVAHVDAARRVFAHEHNGKSGAASSGERGEFLASLSCARFNFAGKRLAVNNLCCQFCSPLI